ncbi:MAG: PEP-CTERM sorting domain-containing protein [Fimbriimonadaceae bacterium]
MAAAMGLLVPMAHAQFLVVPNAYENVAASASGLNTFIRDLGNTRTGQLLINSNQLSTLNVGDQITGFSFRLWTGSTLNFPATTATWTDYTINVGVGVAPLLSTTLLATNFAGTPTMVRSGALVVGAGAYSGTGGPPRPWGTEISFQTPYVYTGGHLAIEVRHTGSDIVNNAANDFLEVATTLDAGYLAGDFRSYTAVGNAATLGALTNFTVTRLSVTPIPEPASIAALGLGALALMRRRKRKTA